MSFRTKGKLRSFFTEIEKDFMLWKTERSYTIWTNVGRSNISVGGNYT